MAEEPGGAPALDATVPRPEPDVLTAGYWESVSRSVLSIQRCQDCGWLTHPPRELCVACGSLEREFAPVSGGGAIYYHCVAHQSFMPAFDPWTPYVLAVVELDEQASLFVVCNFRGPASVLRCGLRVRMAVESNNGLALPQAYPDAATEQFSAVRGPGPERTRA
jgi:uncharacterized OB-fold protein